jgi:hypothetical protein
LAVLTSAAARRYLAWAGATIVLLAGLVAAINIGVDPFYVFGTPLLAGLNRVKPAAEAHEGMAKRHLLPRICGRTLLLGNSRIDVGLDPDSAAWPERMRPVFSAAVAGTGPAVALEMLRLARATCPPRFVVLAVDFPDFLLPPDAGAPIAPPALPGWRERVAELAEATLTLDSAVASVLTLLGQADPFSPTMTAAGHPLKREYVPIARRQGYHALFSAKLAAYRAELRRLPEPVLTPERNSALRILATIVAEARAMPARMVVIIHPYHASYVDLLHETGRWPGFAAWKAAVGELLRREAGSGGTVALLDFGALPETREPVPAAGDRLSDTRYYWEAGHYKAALGDRMIPAIAAVLMP